MKKSLTLEEIRLEKERLERELLKTQHQLDRMENRKKFIEKGEQSKRTHRLCTIGGTVESLVPFIKELSKTEVLEFLESVFSLPEVQSMTEKVYVLHEEKKETEA